MPKLGETLRAQRERRGITLDQAAADTRIREKFLKALEDDDHRGLPGTVYTKGFLRSYADYLGLDAEELIVLFQQERDLPEPSRTFEPMRPVMRRSLIFTPTVFVPVIVLAAIALFLGYLYVQFTTFAVKPPITITDPAGETFTRQSSYVIKGRTVPNGVVHVTVAPGADVIDDVHPDATGSFSVQVRLAPGSNLVTIEVLDQSGKTNRETRRIHLEAAASPSPPAATVALEQPTEGGTYTNLVPVTGTYEAGVTHVAAGGAEVATSITGGRFDLRLTLPAGTQTVRVTARTASGATTELTRTITVRYDRAVVNVAITGGEAWLLATVDGSDVPGTGRVFKAGETAQFIGKEVRLRTGNGAVTVVSYDGEPASTLGPAGAVVEKVYRAP